jgi:hypothetical protein
MLNGAEGEEFDPVASLFDADMPEEEEMEELEEERQEAAQEGGVSLDDLLSESMSLDDLLAESLGIADEAQFISAARARLGRKDSGGLTEVERRELQERVKQWELTHLWQAQASVALFDKVKCNGCGEVHETFVRFMLRCTHRKEEGSVRWVAVKEYDFSLPREVVFQSREVGMCSGCACFEGFNLGEGEEFRYEVD